MTVLNQSVTVSTSATELIGAQSATNQFGLRTHLGIYNSGSVDVYIGGPSVTTSLYTYKLPAGQYMDIASGFKGDGLPSQKWYAVVASATSPVLITEVDGN